MNKLIASIFIISMFVLSVKSKAQCPVNVSLSSNPDVTLNAVCQNTPVEITATPSVGAVNPTYIWVINGDTVSGSGATINVSANNQTVVVYMNTQTGCFPDVDSASIYINTIIIESEATPIIKECNQTVADVTVTSEGGDAPYQYNLVGFGENNIGFFNSVPIGSYTLITTDNNGCTDTSQVDIVPYNCPDPIPAQVFTPNGDGANDTWYIGFIELYPKNEVFIFDRWGQRVYHQENYQNGDGWDAKYLGGDLPVSTFYYILKVQPEYGDEKVFKGAVSIIR
jgi:gliding motility-associated-like protein